MPQLNVVIERKFAVIKEGALDMLFNEKLNDTYQTMLWAEASHTRKLLRNSMETTSNAKSPFGISIEKNPRSLVCYHIWMYFVCHRKVKY